jgi:hypothetical protein
VASTVITGWVQIRSHLAGFCAEPTIMARGWAPRSAE